MSDRTQLEEIKHHLDTRLDKLEDKLDNHLERISKAETSIQWIKGHIRLSASLVIAALSGMAAVIYQYLAK